VLDPNHSSDTYYETYSDWGAKPDSKNIERVKRIIELIPKDVSTILDVGCGDGYLGNVLIDRGYDVTGVDISRKALRFFRGNAVLASIDSLPFKSKSFDLVLSSEVLEHIPFSIYNKSLQELERVANKYIVISTPFNEHLRAGFVLCKKCGCEFHRNRHVRSFNYKDHKNLFVTFQPTKMIGVSTWRMPSKLMLAIQQRLLGIYRINKPTPCACCEHNIPRLRKTWLVRKTLLIMDKLNRLLTQSQFRWFCTRYTRMVNT